VLHLPRYSPELNPIEAVWKQAKCLICANFVGWNKEATDINVGCVLGF
jgi:hypothetical protein